MNKLIKNFLSKTLLNDLAKKEKKINFTHCTLLNDFFRVRSNKRSEFYLTYLVFGILLEFFSDTNKRIF